MASIIENLTNSKTKAVYGIDANLIKLKDVLVCPITQMINLSIRLLVGTIIPVFKSGNKYDVKNDIVLYLQFPK